MLFCLKSGALLILASILAEAPAGEYAQPVPIAISESASMQQIKQAVSTVVGNTCNSIDVRATKVQLTVILLNCPEKSSNARNLEASRIAHALNEILARKEELRGVVALHVDYFTGETFGKHQRRIDGIDFFKNAKGQFRLHIT